MLLLGLLYFVYREIFAPVLFLALSSSLLAVEFKTGLIHSKSYYQSLNKPLCLEEFKTG